MAIKQYKFKWVTILAVSTIILILRVIDFVFEAIGHNYHMTRFGLDIMGTNAFVIQLAIIFASAFLMWKALEKLFSLQLYFSAK